jgi:hypothetical protein
MPDKYAVICYGPESVIGVFNGEPNTNHFGTLTPNVYLRGICRRRHGHHEERRGQSTTEEGYTDMRERQERGSIMKNQSDSNRGMENMDLTLAIPYVREAVILGIRFQNTLEKTIEGTWTHLVNTIRGRAKEMQTWELNMLQSLRDAHIYLIETLVLCTEFTHSIGAGKTNYYFTYLARRDFQSTYLYAT